MSQLNNKKIEDALKRAEAIAARPHWRGDAGYLLDLAAAYRAVRAENERLRAREKGIRDYIAARFPDAHAALTPADEASDE